MEGKALQVEFFKDKKGREPAAEWLDDLDKATRALVLTHIGKFRIGNFGRCRDLKGGLWELKINFGPGYRAYFYKKGAAVVILLCGGDKSSQDRDIAKARRYFAEDNLKKE